MTVTEAIHEHVLKAPAPAWTPAVETDGEARDGAWVAELTGKLLEDWPKGMRLIVCEEQPYPDNQLRITDADVMRISWLAANTAGRPIAELELRHRLPAWAEDRIRPPACATCPCTTPPRTESGRRSSRSRRRDHRRS